MVQNNCSEAKKIVKAEVSLDCFGLLCPMPIIQTAKKIKEMYLGSKEEGKIIKVYIKKTKD